MARNRRKLTTREAIVKVLVDNGGTMTTKEVVEKALPLAKGLKTRTAPHTIYTTMLDESRRINGKVIQVKSGQYRARREDEFLTEAQVARKQKALAKKQAAEATTEAVAA